jgi:carbonic anhydrase
VTTPRNPDTAGYSGTPLPRKLGITPGARVALLHAPPHAPGLLEPLPDGVRLLHRARAPLDVAGGLWPPRPAREAVVAWPKKASKVATDLDENIVRDIGLDAGLVDNKICAVDATWSGLRFVVRRVDRNAARMFDDLLAANRGYAESFPAGHLEAAPVRALAVLTCMDARIDVLAALGLALGDAHVLRNAGGRVTPDALRSLLVSTHVLGVRAVAVVHHTECGMAGTTDAELRERVRAASGADPGALEFHVIADPAQALRDDVAAIASYEPLPADLTVAGFRYDVRTGRLTRQVG